MAYIYKKIINGVPYYYLRVSLRKGKKIIAKDIAYLGSDSSKIKTEIDKLPKKYKNQIRHGYKNIKKVIDSNYYLDKIKRLKLKENPYFSHEQFEGIEAIRLHFNDSFQKHDQLTIRSVYKNFLVEFAYNTTSIEGNTITLEEANKLLREDLTPKEKSSKEIYDLQNTEKVFFYLLNEKLGFNQELLIKIHDMLMENIDARKGYRTHDIRVLRSHFDASPAEYVNADMGLLFRWYEENKSKLHPFVLSVIFHEKFEKIHPFSDGNGRTGRMALIFMLLSNGYPPMIIQKKKRALYINALSSADKANLTKIDPHLFKDLISYMGDEFIDSYWQNFNI